jgi:hypothetical protein
MGERLVQILVYLLLANLIFNPIFKIFLLAEMSGDLPDDLNLDQLYAEMDDVMAAGSDMDVDDTTTTSTIHEKLRLYLEKKRASAAASNDDSPAQGGSSTYLAINRLNKKKLEVPSLYGGTNATIADTGSFKSNCNMTSPMQKSIYSKKRNLGLSFDPSSMTCLSCPVKHGIFGGGGGLRVIDWFFS